MARALMTPDELRRMSMDYCIIYEKGLKPVKAKKLFFYKTHMLKDFNKFKLSHNQYNGGERGAWRRFNPYNPNQGLEDEKEKNLKIDSLDDLFEDDDIKDNTNVNNINISDAKPVDDLLENDSKTKNEFNNNSISDSDLDELLSDDLTDEPNNENSNDILDIQKELEAKFDELFGTIEDDSDS